MSPDVGSPDTARRALERLQMRPRAATAAVWSVTDTGADCLLRVGDGRHGSRLASAELADSTILFERLRRHRAVFCQHGEVSGLEELVPKGVRSFLVVSSPMADHRLGVLVIGWDSSYPPCGPAAIAHLRVAATLLRSLLTATPFQRFDGGTVVAHAQST